MVFGKDYRIEYVVLTTRFNNKIYQQDLTTEDDFQTICTLCKIIKFIHLFSYCINYVYFDLALIFHNSCSKIQSHHNP